jgi:ribosomal protein S18 acetylase RimI-like enzyme
VRPVVVVIAAALTDEQLVRQIHAVQIAAYTIESQLIDYPQLPPLFATVEDFRQSQETFLVCLLDGVVTGATSYLVTADTVEICRLVVHPHYFRRGIGSQLLLAVEQQNPRWQNLMVSTAAQNIPAIGLYEKRGYRIVRHEQLPDGLELVHLQKEHQTQI